METPDKTKSELELNIEKVIDEKIKSQFEIVVDKKISDAKFVISEIKLQFVLKIAGAALAIFGIFVPLLVTVLSSYQVDKSIDRMRDQFKELAGNQLRKPEISCYVGAPRCFKWVA